MDCYKWEEQKGKGVVWNDRKSCVPPFLTCLEAVTLWLSFALFHTQNEGQLFIFTIINSCLMSAERGTSSGSSNLGFIIGQRLLLWVIPVETTHFGVGFRRVELSDWTKWGWGWGGSQDLITSAGRRQIAGQCFEGLRKSKCGCSCVPEGTKLAVL